MGILKLKGKFLTPMVGITNESSRIICYELGVGFVYAEMVNDKAILRKKNERIL
ncbi:tRNA-dihydrouridine synthase [Spiroplasma endosymbiont of Polydrusus formosus]|uniref:tRNA-dihydrouridine synthase n=1 Tax=Spiroplasma endosymbiont of Polydrusus formosus TaxID=3139326 RepID=UPI0035B50972